MDLTSGRYCVLNQPFKPRFVIGRVYFVFAIEPGAYYADELFEPGGFQGPGNVLLRGEIAHVAEEERDTNLRYGRPRTALTCNALSRSAASTATAAAPVLLQHVDKKLAFSKPKRPARILVNIGIASRITCGNWRARLVD